MPDIVRVGNMVLETVGGVGRLDMKFSNSLRLFNRIQSTFEIGTPH